MTTGCGLSASDSQETGSTMRSKSRRPSRAKVLVALITCLMSLSLSALPAAAAPPAATTVSFSYTGAEQTWTVPANARAVMVEAWGAQGGSSHKGLGGRGGYAKATVAVTPGEILRVYVGGQGSYYTSSAAADALVGGGWNGGGHTRNGTSIYNTGGGGGGASDVRQGGTGLTDRKVVASGGGGGGGGRHSDTIDYSGTGGGGGGGFFGGGAGGSGGSGFTGQTTTGGTGGTQTSGGAGGVGVISTSDNGSLGQGGNAGMGELETNPSGAFPGEGGAGGGLNGANGGNGGGSGTLQTGAGGGGGSSFVSGTDTQTLSDQRLGNGLVTITYWAVEPPAVPLLLSPVEGTNWGTTATQQFVVRATDPNGDGYVAKVTVEDLDRGDTFQFESMQTASGTDATVPASRPLLQGPYRWKAQACDQPAFPYPAGCSSQSAWVNFSIGGVLGNQAPSSPEIIAPQANSTFEAGERQDFTIRTTDIDNDTYTGDIDFVNAVTQQAMPHHVDTSPAPSGGPSTGSLGTNGLPAGSYVMKANATDSNNATGPTTEQVIGVAAAVTSPCIGGTSLVDGWFGDRYLQLSGATVDGVGYVCVRTNVSGVDGKPVAGWLRAESGGGGGAPTVGTTAACSDAGEDSLPFPFVDAKVGNPNNPTHQLYADLRLSDDALTACFRVKANGGNLLDTSVTIQAPAGVELTDLNFVPEVLAPGWTPPAPAAPPAGLPSSECYQAPVGKTLIANADVDGQHVWLYQQQDPTVSRVCARIQGSASKGVVVRHEGGGGGGQPFTLTSGRPADDPATPCRTDDYQLYSDTPLVTRLHITQTTADPVGACLFAGPNSTTGLSAWLLVDRTPSAGTVTHGIDP